MKYIPAVLFSASLLLLYSSPLSAEERSALNHRKTVPLTFNDPENNIGPTMPKGSISIRIDNIRNTEGILGIALFSSKAGFPDQTEKAFALASVETGESLREVVIENIPYGIYALSVLHDENGNRKMDKTWIGKPKEGFGTSNNPKIRFGPPEFDESGFVLDRETVNMTIDIKYL